MIDVEVGAAVLAGLIAGAVMEGPAYLQKAMGLTVNQHVFGTWKILLGQRGTGGCRCQPGDLNREERCSPRTGEQETAVPPHPDLTRGRSGSVLSRPAWEWAR